MNSAHIEALEMFYDTAPLLHGKVKVQRMQDESGIPNCDVIINGLKQGVIFTLYEAPHSYGGTVVTETGVKMPGVHVELDKNMLNWFYSEFQKKGWQVGFLIHDSRDTLYCATLSTILAQRASLNKSAKGYHVGEHFWRTVGLYLG